MNGLFNLTSQEIEVLDALIRADSITPCSKKARKIVCDEMKFNTPVVVANYIKALRNKKAIIKDNDGYYFNPMLVLQPDQTAIEFVWE